MLGERGCRWSSEHQQGRSHRWVTECGDREPLKEYSYKSEDSQAD